MMRRLSLAVSISLVVACNGPNKPSGSVTLASLSLTGQTNFSAVGQTSQLTVSGNFSNGNRQDVTGQVTWTVQNPSVATISTSGLLRAAGYGSTSIIATFQSMTATATVQVTLLQTGLTLSPGNTTLTGPGQTAQFTLAAIYADGSTRDVSSEASWTSDSAEVFSISSSGLVTATALGAGTLSVRYPPGTGQSKSAQVVVTPPGTFAVRGGTRSPGEGGLSNVTVVDQTTRQSTTTKNGGFTLGGLRGGTLTFDLTGWETASVQTVADGTLLQSLDVPMQQVIRVDVGSSVTRSIAPHDMSYLISDGVRCYPCQLVRVRVSSSGMVHLDASWTNSRSILHMWINGVDFPGANVGPSSVAADVAAAAGELLVYVGQPVNNNAQYVTFTLTSERR